MRIVQYMKEITDTPSDTPQWTFTLRLTDLQLLLQLTPSFT